VMKHKGRQRRIAPRLLSVLLAVSLLPFSVPMKVEAKGAAEVEYVYDESLKVEEASNPDISIEIIDRLLAKKKMRNIEITKDIVDSILNIMKINEKLKVAMEEV
ncbi:MAG: hypothetical protein ACI4U3_06860, partial [Traorella sp.]